MCVKRAKMELENPALQSEDETLYSSGQQIKIDENKNKETVELQIKKPHPKVTPHHTENSQKLQLSEPSMKVVVAPSRALRNHAQAEQVTLTPA
jgi:hypothetical protein